MISQLIFVLIFVGPKHSNNVPFCSQMWWKKIIHLLIVWVTPTPASIWPVVPYIWIMKETVETYVSLYPKFDIVIKFWQPKQRNNLLFKPKRNRKLILDYSIVWYQYKYILDPDVGPIETNNRNKSVREIYFPLLQLLILFSNFVRLNCSRNVSLDICILWKWILHYSIVWGQSKSCPNLTSVYTDKNNKRNSVRTNIFPPSKCWYCFHIYRDQNLATTYRSTFWDAVN